MRAISVLLAGCAFFADAAAAYAQVTPADPASQAAADGTTRSSADAATPPGTQLSDIVVTAQRRSENLQRTPLSIAVVGGSALTQGGVTQAQDLNGIVAGFQLGIAANTAQPYIRGVGNADNSGFAVSGIAFNVDGVYVAQPVGYGSSLFDVQRLEVLRGPQGTLYGRNASGGAVNIITNRPTYDNGGYIGAEYGNYDQVRLNGAINLVAVPDKVAIRAAVQYGNRDGYFRDGTSDENTIKGRLRVRLDPTPDLSVLVNVEASRENGHGPGFALDTGTSYNLPFTWEGPQGPNSTPFLNALNVTQPPRQRQRNFNTSAEFNLKLDDHFTLTVLPAYRDVKVGLVNYNGFRYVINKNTYKEFSGETRLSYDSDKLKMVGGLYYFHQKQTLDFLVDNFPIELTGVVPDLTTESYAAFGQATYSVTDRLRLTGGLRYSHEKQVLAPSANTFLPIFPPLAGVVAFQGSDTSHAINYRAAVEYDLTPTSLLFASAATGYKAGGVFPSPTGPFGGNTFKPEKLDAYTVGLKNRFLDGALQLNVEGFYWRYKNKQETFTSTNGLGNVDNVTKNAPLSIIYGADIDAVWRLTTADTIRGTFEYLHAEYRDFTYTTIAPNVGCPTTASGAFFTINCDGKEMARSPRWSGSAGYDHQFELGSAGTLTASGTAKFSAARWLAVYYNAPVRAPSYVKGDFQLTYQPENKRFSITGYVRNVGNKAIATGAYNSLKPNVYWLPLEAPRTYGVQARVDF